MIIVTWQNYLLKLRTLSFKSNTRFSVVKGFHKYDISILISDILFMQTVLVVSVRSWWSTGMIPKKVTWVQFPGSISTV